VQIRTDTREQTLVFQLGTCASAREYAEEIRVVFPRVRTTGYEVDRFKPSPRLAVSTVEIREIEELRPAILCASHIPCLRSYTDKQMELRLLILLYASLAIQAKTMDDSSTVRTLW
jgi:hypothetical protein